MTEVFPKIKSIEIANLFGEKDLKWDLEDSVNVLVGNNGTGKSTLLEIIRELFLGKNIKFLGKTTYAKIEFTDHASITHKMNDINLDDLNKLLKFLKEKKAINGQNKKLLENIQKVTENESHQSINVAIGGMLFSRGSSIKSEQDIAVEYVSTVNISANSINEIKGSDGETKNVLDIEISEQLSRLQTKQTTDENTYLKIKKRVHDSLNLFLGDSGKSVSFDKDIIITYKDKKIGISSLSSGEKQVIYIFLKVANAYFDRAIILMDEPEISLHLNWQEKLISTIRAINPESQLIIVTHSPAIVMKGWLSYFKDISDITVGNKS